MAWEIEVHPLVLKEDFRQLPSSEQKFVVRMIRKKLSIDPRAFGKPLTCEFKGYWRLATGDYRVIYRIVESKVLVSIIKVGIRRDDRVYQEFWNRLRKL